MLIYLSIFVQMSDEGNRHTLQVELVIPRAPHSHTKHEITHTPIHTVRTHTKFPILFGTHEAWVYSQIIRLFVPVGMTIVFIPDHVHPIKTLPVD